MCCCKLGLELMMLSNKKLYIQFPDKLAELSCAPELEKDLCYLSHQIWIVCRSLMCLLVIKQ